MTIIYVIDFAAIARAHADHERSVAHREALDWYAAHSILAKRWRAG